MEAAEIAEEIGALPAEAQEQLVDFVAFLKTRYATAQTPRPARRTPLADEPFVGMWRGRKDLEDSTAWVRGLRRREWERCR